MKIREETIETKRIAKANRLGANAEKSVIGRNDNPNK
jgi:hypothetical protein